MQQLTCIYLSKVPTDCWFSESSSVGLVGLCADFGGMGGREGTSHFHLISALSFYFFVYIRRDRLWVGESIVTSCGELGGAGRLQWRANSFAINVLSSNERWRLETPIVESKREHGITPVNKTSHFQGKKLFTQLLILMEMQGNSAKNDKIIKSSRTMPSGGTIVSNLVLT
jgi:hypothetical protein